MTYHYTEKCEEMNIKEVLFGWKYHDNKIPPAFGVFSEGDFIAYNCWKYMTMDKKDRPIPKEYCSKMEQENFKNKLIEILNELIKQGY